MTNRILAEERLAERRHQAEPSTPQTPTANEGLIHDLQVHQIELEMQNEELQRTQEQLHESLEKYSDLYDFAPVGYIILCQDGLIQEANLTFSNQLDSERARLIGTPLWLYTDSGGRGLLQSHLQQVLTTNDRQRCELQLEKRDGRKFYVQLDSIPVQSGNDVQLCRTSVTDISARKGFELELIKIHNELERRVQERTAELFVNERKFRILSREFETLLTAITDILILFSPKMDVLWTNNKEAEQLPEAESNKAKEYCYALLQNFAVFGPDDPIERCFKTGEMEVAIKTYHGAMLDLRAFPVKEAGKVNSVLLLISDITEKMLMQAEAMHAGHMASLGELASGVAHEINNPVTGIINYGQILLNECRPESMERDLGGRIVKEGNRIGRIVKTLLSYARDGREEKRSTPLSTILEESIILTQSQIRKEGINLKIDLADDLPEIHADLQQIQQSFINIINNARYALNEKYPGRHENKRLEITGEKITAGDRLFVRIVFYDRGEGIEAHELPLVTKQFFSTKPFGKGTGLGLNITEKIIKDHGGNLRFESSKGEFTRVIIELPAERHKDGGGK